MNRYDYNLNYRLQDHLENLCKSAEKGKGKLVDQTVKEVLTVLDRLYIFVAPDQENAQFKLSDETISQSVEGSGFNGEAADMCRERLQKLEQSFNAHLIVKSQEQFDNHGALFEFIDGNEAVLDLVRRDSVFFDRLLDKMRQMINIAKAKEKTLSAAGLMFKKTTHAVTGKNWTSESMIRVREDIFDKLIGKLSAEEIIALMSKPGEELKSYEISRLFHNVNMAHQFLYKEDWQSQLGIGDCIDSEKARKFAEGEIDGDELKAVVSAIWVAFCKVNDKNDPLFFNMSHIHMDILYDALFWHCDKHPQVTETLLKHILEKATPQEIDLFLPILNWGSYDQMRFFNQPEKNCEEYIKKGERANLALRCIPSKKSYLEAHSYHPHGQVETQLAILLLVQSIQKKDFEGVAVAISLLKRGESINNSFGNITVRLANDKEREVKRELRDAGALTQEEYSKIPVYIDPHDAGTLKLCRLAKDLLTEEELELFKKNYYPEFPFDQMFSRLETPPFKEPVDGEEERDVSIEQGMEEKKIESSQEPPSESPPTEEPDKNESHITEAVEETPPEITIENLEARLAKLAELPPPTLDERDLELEARLAKLELPLAPPIPSRKFQPKPVRDNV